jgi:hypothetical protein
MSQTLGLETESASAPLSLERLRAGSRCRDSKLRLDVRNSARSAAKPRPAPRLSQFPGCQEINEEYIYIYIYIILCIEYVPEIGSGSGVGKRSAQSRSGTRDSIASAADRAQSISRACQYIYIYLNFYFLNLFYVLYICIQHFILNMSRKLSLGQLPASVLHGLEQLQGRSFHGLNRHGLIATGATGTRSCIVRRTSASEHG